MLKGILHYLFEVIDLFHSTNFNEGNKSQTLSKRVDVLVKCFVRVF
jgi:hypothetical protein